MENAAGPSNTLFYCSLLGFTIISWLLWKCVFSPPAAQTTTSSSSAATGAGSSTSSTTAARTTRPSSTRSTPSTTSSNVSTKDSEDGSFSFGQPRHPPHFIAPENWTRNKTNLSGCLLQGVVPFRSTPASGYEVCLQKKELATTATTNDIVKEDEKSTPAPDLIVVNRRERARIFARMFSAQKAGARPPNRGANIVVTVQHTDVTCDKLQKTLYLLGTYYNLFLLVDGSGGFDGSSDEEVREFIKKLRSELLNQGSDGAEDDSNQYKLNAQILPPHRIAFSSTSKGRIAFVRQLHGAELVVDCEEDVTKELERFGFRVLLYPKSNEGTAVSSLGKFLIP